MAIRTLNKNFLEFLQELNAHKVKYLVVGGYAVIHHGYSRSTQDMDLFVAMEPDNAERICAAITAFGFDADEYSPEFFLTPGSILMIGRIPVRIDLFTTLKGLEFDEAYKNRVYFSIGETRIPFVSREDLIKSKKASGRDRDKDDLKRLGEK